MNQAGVATLIRVLIVDDSAFVRKVLRQILARSPFIDVVGAARDGKEALELVEELNPDVVTLDMNMPSFDGVAFLRAQMERRPIPVLVVSTEGRDGKLVLEALEVGAIDVIQKPTGLANERLFELGESLIAKIKSVAAAPLQRRSIPAPIPIPQRTQNHQLTYDILVCGISTGGPQALRFLVAQFPASFPIPVVIVLHMPIGYTELFARNLNEVCELDVKEAAEGELVGPGSVLIAPAGYHLSFRKRNSKEVVTHLDLLPLDTPHRPAVDVLFQSAAEIYGERALGIVMTGMGNDGTKGAGWIKAKGGTIFTESEESCVVYGMPRSVVEAGLSDRSISLEHMAATILESI